MPHYYDQVITSDSKVEEFSYHFHNEAFTFKTDRGVFSKDGVDYASYLLISYVSNIDLGKHVLDYGCGWGPIGIILKRMHPDLIIDLVDVNPRAVALAKDNSYWNHTEVEVIQSVDITTLNKTYDTVILNPPIRAGKTVIYDMYQKAHDVLNDKGSLYIVIKVKHGAKSHFNELTGLFARVDLIDKIDGHWLIKATR